MSELPPGIVTEFWSAGVAPLSSERSDNLGEVYFKLVTVELMGAQISWPLPMGCLILASLCIG